MSNSQFLWGSATSSHQVEGGNEHNDWWAFEADGCVEGGARSGAATDHWRLFREDLAQAKYLGMNTYRFSVEWSRIEPKQGEWDPAALAWYSALVDECASLGLMPMLTLHHFTSPQWFAALGGFTHPEAPAFFLKFVEKVAERLGTRVPLWCTFNEPVVLIVGAYIGRFMPPAVYAPDLAAKAFAGILAAHVAAYDYLRANLMRREGPWKEEPVAIGIAHNLIDFYPDRKFSPADQMLVYLIERFYNRAFVDAVVGKAQKFTVPGLVPRSRPVRSALGRVTTDFIGINYYTKAYLRFWPKNKSLQNLPEAFVGMTFARLNEVATDSGWAVHPEGLRRMIRRMKAYGLPLYITENGIADRKDELRPKYLLDHLKVVAEEIAAGCDIRGYYYWSLLDNFEWIKGFGPRFGLLRVDYDNFARKPTGSARLYREILSAHEGKPPNLELLKRLRAP